MAAALAAHDAGLSVLIVEKSSYVGGSTARSGGALWLPGSPVLSEAGAGDNAERAKTYLRSVVADTAPRERSERFVDQLSATVDMLRRTTPMKLFWARDYSDYHPEAPGGSAAGRTCECRPLDTSVLGEYLTRLRPGVLEAKVPMPTTGADYRWMNLMARVPRKGIPTIAKRLAQGVGGLLLGRRYAAGGQALAAGLFSGVLDAGIPIWTDATLVGLVEDGGHVTGAVVEHARTADHRDGAPRGGAGRGRLRPRHGDALEVPVQHARIRAQPWRRHQHRRRDPCCAGRRRGTGPDGPGLVVSRGGPAARPAARRHARRTLVARVADRQPGRRAVRQRVDRLHVVRSARARTRTRGQAGRDDVDRVRPAVSQRLRVRR